jgi:hypothetical protein
MAKRVVRRKARKAGRGAGKRKVRRLQRGRGAMTPWQGFKFGFSIPLRLAGALAPTVAPFL